MERSFGIGSRMGGTIMVMYQYLNVYRTPHVGWASGAQSSRLGDELDDYPRHRSVPCDCFALRCIFYSCVSKNSFPHAMAPETHAPFGSFGRIIPPHCVPSIQSHSSPVRARKADTPIGIFRPVFRRTTESTALCRSDSSFSTGPSMMFGCDPSLPSRTHARKEF